jgi:hypothetical protein
MARERRARKARPARSRFGRRVFFDTSAFLALVDENDGHFAQMGFVIASTANL